MLWEVDIYPAEGNPDMLASRVAAAARDLGLGNQLSVTAAEGYLLEGTLERDAVERLAADLLADRIVQRTVIGRPVEEAISQPPTGQARLIHVLPKPGVMDPVAQSVQQACADLGVELDAVRTLRKYWFSGLDDSALETLCGKVLANDAIEQVIVGPLGFDRIGLGSAYEFNKLVTPICQLDDEQLAALSRTGQLYLSLAEMQTIAAHFRELGREPTDIELETVAQTWSEHCSHKTLAGRIRYQDEQGQRQFENMLKETIFAATQQIRKDLGDDDWCVSVFEDMTTGLRDVDVAIALRIQNERMESALLPGSSEFYGLYGLTRERLKVASPNVFVMHPGPINRGVEIESEVADGPNSLILKQVNYGIAVRMAVLAMTVEGQLAAQAAVQSRVLEGDGQ